MKPSAFEYEVPESLDAALATLAQLGDEAKLLAGGQSLIPMLALRLTAFEHLVDIGPLAELKGIRREDGFLRIGAATVDRVVGRDPEVAASVPLLTKVTPLIGHFQIRNRGTIGGSIAHADSAAEYPTVALALDAEMEVASSSGTRTIPADEFFESTWTTSLEGDEILTAIRFPVWSGRCGFGVEELARRHGDFALTGAVCGVEIGDSGEVRRCAIALLGMDSTPVRASPAESALLGRTPSAEDLTEVGHLAVQAADPPSDLHASSEYRRQVGGEMVRRALRQALEEAAR
ncbi:MAG TPA: xanthine dehydrogenase family protein subunit M [Acidimicrobiales bacterium]|nr:xanthine dehydrogenase family protein subunit M [Acidimicrobiales bacterium]